jgi:hypothetical protein
MYGHTGGDNGVFTIMTYEPEGKRGFIILFNGDFNRSDANGKNMYDLISAIYESMFN